MKVGDKLVFQSHPCTVMHITNDGKVAWVQFPESLASEPYRISDDGNSIIPDCGIPLFRQKNTEQSNGMKEIMRVCLSENGKEFLLYSEDGSELERVIAVKDFDSVADAAKEAAEIAFRDAFADSNGREFMSCMGYQDCAPGLCDEHYENEGAY